MFNRLLKTSLNLKIISVLLLLLIAAFLRFYNFSNRLTFGPEQALSLITPAEYLTTKPSLLGMPYLQRVTSHGHQLFHSSLFSYSLVPLLFLFRFQPLPITAFFTLLNLFTGLLLYFLVKKAANHFLAWLAMFFFLFNSTMIHHSLFIWIINYWPLVGLLSAYCFYLFLKKKHPHKQVFLLGLLSGIGFGLDYMYLPTAVILSFMVILSSRSKTKHLIYFSSGALLGDLPRIVFDLKHNFYHLQSLWQFFLDFLYQRAPSNIAYYHFLQFWPILALIIALITYLLLKANKLLAISFIIFYLFINFRSPYFNLYQSIGMTKGVTLSTFQQIAQIINKDNPPERFNLAVLLDFDTRAHPVRYLLTYIHGLKPQPVEQYTNLDALYVFAPPDYPFEKPRVWELKTHQPYQLENLAFPHPSFQLYKLTK